MEQPTIKNIHQSIAAIMRTVEAVKKDRVNEQQKFKYRGIDQILNALHAAFATEGVTIRVAKIRTIERQERTAKSGSIMLYSVNDYKFVFTAEDGSTVSAWARGEGQDSADKSTSKAVSVALKYCLLQMFLIPSYEMADNEADAYHEELGGKGKTPKPAEEKPATQAEIEAAKKALDKATTPGELKEIWDETLTKTQRTAPGIFDYKEARKAAISPAVVPPEQPAK